MDLKAETIGLAVDARAADADHRRPARRPSTGMPTKTEQSDLLMALYGRHGESPLPIVARRRRRSASTPALDAVRIAVRYRTPVILLTDLFLANSSEPWRIPTRRAAGDRPGVRDRADRGGRSSRMRATPRRAALGGAGHARSAAPDRRDREGPCTRRDLLRARQPRAMTEQRAASRRADRGAAAASTPTRRGAAGARLGLELRHAARRRAAPARRGRPIAHAHFHNLNPLPANTGEVLGLQAVLVPELNDGQLVSCCAPSSLVDLDGHAKAEGRPLFAAEIERALLERLRATLPAAATRQNGIASGTQATARPR